jgi:hypothetical protein
MSRQRFSHKRTCMQCGHLREVAGKGPICGPCRTRALPDDRLCTQCLRPKRLRRRANGLPVCLSCALGNATGTCSVCGAPGIRGRHLCSKHIYYANLARQPIGQCTTCQRDNERLVHDTCLRCRQRVETRRHVRHVLEELFGTSVQQPQLAALINYVNCHRNPSHTGLWLRRIAPGIVKYLMRAVAGHELDADGILDLRHLPGGPFLLNAVKESGCIPLPSLSARCKRFVNHLTVDVSVAARSMLMAYAAHFDREHLRLRDQRTASWDLPQSDRRHLRTALHILQWCEQTAGSPEALTHADVELNLRHKCQDYRRHAHSFLTWLADAGKLHCRPMPMQRGPRQSARLAEGELHRVLDRALHDEAMPLRVRVTLLFIILGCRMPAEFCSLRSEAVRVLSQDQVEIRFAQGIPQLFDGLAASLIITLAQSDSDWLFPSRSPIGHLVPNSMQRFFYRHALPLPRVLHNSALWEKLKEHSAAEMALSLGRSAMWIWHIGERLHPVDPAHRAYIAQLAER